MKLLSPGSTNTKLAKGTASTARYLNFILHLAPSDLSGRNVCPNASPGCIASCLNTAGRGVFSNIQAARIRKTQYFFNDRDGFLLDLISDLKSIERKAKKLGLMPVVRLNGTSDIPWENIKLAALGETDSINIFDLFPNIQFYDYTKSARRAINSATKPNWPKNYHLTFSKSEINALECLDVLAKGVSVAVVFKGELPSEYMGVPVINGDSHDYRFLDRRGVIVGLTAKGKAKRDRSGFVVSSASAQPCPSLATVSPINQSR